MSRVIYKAPITAIPDNLFEHGLGPYHLSILCFLFYAAKEEGDFVTYPVISRATKICERTIYKVIKELETWGFIKRIEKTNPQDRRTRFDYEIQPINKAKMVQ